ncbi:coiled-coil domain-containing protein 12 [Striga asiatica]|uniref:Coiled-coil domain-containing protein 12 n=1 Tax=Striga asiatica TaxID=4170 RepID=A0A5A7QGY4_STRAF|nr:coiled-coil domain-containing protein 12 [Striga asiatica]
MAGGEEESVEAAALARRERLRALKAAQELLNTPDENAEHGNNQQPQEQLEHEKDEDDNEDDNDQEKANVTVKFRNYLPHDKQLQEGKVAPPVLPKFEDPALAALPLEEKKKEDPFLNIAPKKPNWDLRRDVQKKLDKLERRTQKAMLVLTEQEANRRSREDRENAYSRWVLRFYEERRIRAIHRSVLIASSRVSSDGSTVVRYHAMLPGMRTALNDVVRVRALRMHERWAAARCTRASSGLPCAHPSACESYRALCMATARCAHVLHRGPLATVSQHPCNSVAAVAQLLGHRDSMLYVARAFFMRNCFRCGRRISTDLASRSVSHRGCPSSSANIMIKK